MLDVQKRIVQRCGFPCLTAASAEDAVTTLREHPEVELIVLDAILPDARGVDLFDSLKRIKPRVKVIVCTGLTQDGPGRDICQAGADDFLPKPFTAEAFMDRVKAVLGAPVES
ncbi:MAG: response regulator [Phycisphaerae bacterium]|nr:response regulator [Phycisphaerae bacterium]